MGLPSVSSVYHLMWNYEIVDNSRLRYQHGSCNYQFTPPRRRQVAMHAHSVLADCGVQRAPAICHFNISHFTFALVLVLTYQCPKVIPGGEYPALMLFELSTVPNAHALTLRGLDWHHSRMITSIRLVSHSFMTILSPARPSPLPRPSSFSFSLSSMVYFDQPQPAQAFN